MIPLNITEQTITSLLNGEAIRTRDITANKTKVICVKVKDTNVRIKVTPSLTIMVRDTNTAFIKALFPDYIERYESSRSRHDYSDINGAITFMRLRMELRRDLLDAVFADPNRTIQLLELEHETSFRDSKARS